MTLDELSRKSEVSKSLLSVAERNFSAPTVRTLEKVVRALGTLGTTVSSLYSGMENSKKEAVNPGKLAIIHKKERKNRSWARKEEKRTMPYCPLIINENCKLCTFIFLLEERQVNSAVMKAKSVVSFWTMN